MDGVIDPVDRRTAADMVFERLHEEIESLALLPGTKLSETDVARRFGVSRQPVREAFNRLDQLDLLTIRPQRATVVRGFSIAAIGHARFIRLAVELEVARRACATGDADALATLEKSLEEQRRAVEGDDQDLFHALDSAFHESLCVIAGVPLAAETIHDCKRRIDRLCRLSLGREREADTLLRDHRALADALQAGDPDRATAVVREHLARLDGTIADIRRSHSEYFE